MTIGFPKGYVGEKFFLSFLFNSTVWNQIFLILWNRNQERTFTETVKKKKEEFPWTLFIIYPLTFAPQISTLMCILLCIFQSVAIFSFLFFFFLSEIKDQVFLSDFSWTIHPSKKNHWKSGGSRDVHCSKLREREREGPTVECHVELESVFSCGSY